MSDDATCTGGKDRIRFGEEQTVKPGEVYGGNWVDDAPALYIARNDDECPDCGVSPGEFHKKGCDVEQCPECFTQLIGCEHGAKYLAEVRDVSDRAPTEQEKRELQRAVANHLLRDRGDVCPVCGDSPVFEVTEGRVWGWNFPDLCFQDGALYIHETATPTEYRNESENWPENQWPGLQGIRVEASISDECGGPDHAFYIPADEMNDTKNTDSDR